MENWVRKLFLSMLLILLAVDLCAGSASAETLKILKIKQINGNGKVFIPQIQGMTEISTQAMLNTNIQEAMFSLNNFVPGSSLNGDFTVSFYNENILGIHFKGNSFNEGTAHPNKIDQGIHMDLATGQIYKLADLFIAGVDFESRIKEQCKINRERYRLQIEGLWNGWKHEQFINSWQGADAAFLLSDKAVRVYTIPSYAAGAISGYNVPYTDLMDIIDQKSILWRKIQGKPTLPISVSSDIIIDKTCVKVGDVYAGLTVASVDLRNGSLVDLRFTGEKELVGVSEWVDNIGDGAGYIFTVDTIDSLPMLKGYNPKNALVLTMEENSPDLPREKTHVKIIVDNYSIGERQLMSRARLVKIMPYE